MRTKIGSIAMQYADPGPAGSDLPVVLRGGSFSEDVLCDLKPCCTADFVVCGRRIHIDRAVFDTGSNITVILKSVLDENLVAAHDDSAESRDANGSHTSSIHKNCILELPGGIVIGNLEIWDSNLEWLRDMGIGAIIGMDVLTVGELRLWSKYHLPRFSFDVNTRK